MNIDKTNKSQIEGHEAHRKAIQDIFDSNLNAQLGVDMIDVITSAMDDKPDWSDVDATISMHLQLIDDYINNPTSQNEEMLEASISDIENFLVKIRNYYINKD